MVSVGGSAPSATARAVADVVVAAGGGRDPREGRQQRAGLRLTLVGNDKRRVTGWRGRGLRGGA